MKSSSPRRVAIVVAGCLALFTGLLIGINIFVVVDQRVPYLIFSALLTFILTFVSIFYILNSFILDKIKPIYHTINTIKIPSDELFTNIEDKDILQEVRKEVIEWAQNRTKEIVQLKANEKYRKEFLGNVSHELKTPIFNIQGYVLTLLDGGIDDPEINQTYLKRTEKNINRLITIVNDLDTISRLETGELKMEYENFDILALVTEIYDMHEMMTVNNQIELRMDEPPRKPLCVYGDRKKITQVLTNLVVNSVKYGVAGGFTNVWFEEQDNKILINVEDNGIGIPASHLSRIFERFYRVDKHRSREQGGTGLGLAIAKHIIEAHNQKIYVSSTEGKGTIFTFTLDKSKYNGPNPKY